MAKSLQVAAQRLLGSRSVLLELSESFSVFARSSTGLQQANAGTGLQPPTQRSLLLGVLVGMPLLSQCTHSFFIVLCTLDVTGISSSTNTRSPSSASIPCMGSRFAPTTGGSAAAGQQLWQPHAAAISPAAATVSATGAWPAQLLRSFSSSPAHNSQCDCPTLGGPQPDVVMVEYDEEEVDR